MAPVVGLVGLGLFQRGFPAVCSNCATSSMLPLIFHFNHKINEKVSHFYFILFSAGQMCRNRNPDAVVGHRTISGT